MSTSATAATPQEMWTGLGYAAGTPVTISFYFYMSGLGAAINPPIYRLRTSGAVQVMRLVRTSTGKIQIVDSGTTQIGITVNNLSITTLYRFEFTVTVTGGLITFAYYLGNSTTPVETPINISAASLGAAGIDEVTLGQVGSLSNLPAEWFAIPTITDTGPIGPAVQTIAPSGIASQEVFGSPTISTSYTLSPNGILSQEQFGNPAITQVVSPTGIASQEAFGSPTITTSATISAQGIPSREQFGNPTISTTATIAPTGIASAQAFGSPTITAPAIISPTGIASCEKFGTPTITLTISPTGIPSQQAFGAPSVSRGLSPRTPDVSVSVAALKANLSLQVPVVRTSIGPKTVDVSVK
jgi:hypothetical protein